jgi:hypothetical protein
MDLQDYQLKQRQYDMCTLAAHMGTLSKVKVLTTQRLTVEFCARYLLIPDDSEDEVTFLDVLKCQPHISTQELKTACQEIETDRLRHPHL